MSPWISAMKVLVISAGAVFVALGIKASIPAEVNDAPAVLSAVLSWLKPPYLYAVVNGIIITIVASSRLQQVRDSDPPVRGDRHLISVRTPPLSEFESLSAEPDIKNVVEEQKAAVVLYESGDRIVELKPVMVNGSSVVDGEDEEKLAGDSDDGDESDYFLEATARISPEFLLEYTPAVEEKKPPVPSGRFDRRKPSTTAPEGAAARKLAKYDTMESVWKMIMEARDESHARAGDPPAPSSSLRGEASPSEDEVNRRAEEFIQKFNDEMRQQRQRSLDRRMKKIGGGPHT